MKPNITLSLNEDPIYQAACQAVVNQSMANSPLPLMDPFWHSPSLEEIARAQGVQPITNLEVIMGGWPEEELDDGFEEAILRWRHEGL